MKRRRKPTQTHSHADNFPKQHKLPKRTYKVNTHWKASGNNCCMYADDTLIYMHSLHLVSFCKNMASSCRRPDVGCFSLRCLNVLRKRVNNINSISNKSHSETKWRWVCLTVLRKLVGEEEGRRGVFPQPQQLQQRQHWGCGHLLAVLVWPTERLDDEALAAVQAVGQVLLVTWLEVFRVQRRDSRRSCHTKTKEKC